MKNNFLTSFILAEVGDLPQNSHALTLIMTGGGGFALIFFIIVIKKMPADRALCHFSKLLYFGLNVFL